MCKSVYVRLRWSVFNHARLTSVFVPAPCRQRSLSLGILCRTAFGTVSMLEQYRLLFVEVAGQSVAVKVSRAKWKSTYNIVSDTSVLMIASITSRLIRIR